MIFKIFMTLAATFALIHLPKTTNKWAKFIVIGQSIAIGLTLIPNESVVTFGFLIYILITLLIVAFALIKRSSDTKKSNTILLISTSLLISHIFTLMYWPGSATIGFLMLLPILVFFKYVLKNLKDYKNELGFLTILITDASIHFLILLIWRISN